MTQGRILTVSTLFLLLLLLVPLPFLPEYGGANSSTRVMLTQALVEERTTRIDRHAALTVDKAFHDGHFYSDKAPGMAFLSLPAYALGRAALAGQGRELDLMAPLAQGRGLDAAEMVVYRAMALVSGGLLMALAGVAALWMGHRLSGGLRPALLATATVFLATPYLGWSVQLFGHAAAGACLMLAFALACGLRSSGPRMTARAMAAGAALGLAVGIEYTAAPPAALIAAYAIWQLRGLDRGRALSALGLAVLAALVMLAPVLIYHQLSFGSPFAVGYSGVVGFEGMQQGFLGLTWPDPAALWGITFGFRRGVFWLAPVLILVPVGLWLAWRAKAWRLELAVSMLVIIYYFWLNSSYYYWEGGSSLGPRHVMPAVLFAILPLQWLWTHAEGHLRKALTGLTLFGLIAALAAAMTTMTPNLGYRFPLVNPVLSGLFSEDQAFRHWHALGVQGDTLFIGWALGSLGLGGLLWYLAGVWDEAGRAAPAGVAGQ